MSKIGHVLRPGRSLRGLPSRFSLFAARKISWIVWPVLVMLATAGCGGGGGGGSRQPAGSAFTMRAEPNHDLEAVNTAAAVSALKPEAIVKATAVGTTALQAFEQDAPLDDFKLRQHLNTFAVLANDQPSDAAAQLGLSLSLVAAGVVNGAHILGAELPKDFYAPVVPLQLEKKAFQPAGAVAKAMAVALKPVELLPDQPTRQVQTSALVPGRTFTTQEVQAALAEIVIPSIAQAMDRLANLIEHSPANTLLISYEDKDGEIWHIYRQDLKAMLVALKLVHAAAIFANAYDWNWGSYDIQSDLTEHDVNGDGILTVGEALPPDPFATLHPDGPQALSTALSELRQAVQAAADLLANIPDDDRSPLSHALEDASDADIAHWRQQLQDAQDILNGQVNVQVEYAWWDDDGERLVNEHSATVPLNLPVWFTNPVADLKSLLPPLYVVPTGRFEGDQETCIVDIEFAPDNLRISIRSNNGDVQLKRTEPLTRQELLAHRVFFPDASGADFIQWTDDFSTVFVQASSIGSFQASETDDSGTDVIYLPSELPDPTLGGVLPSPQVLWEQVWGMPKADAVVMTYGTLRYKSFSSWEVQEAWESTHDS